MSRNRFLIVCFIILIISYLGYGLPLSLVLLLLCGIGSDGHYLNPAWFYWCGQISLYVSLIGILLFILLIKRKRYVNRKLCALFILSLLLFSAYVLVFQDQYAFYTLASNNFSLSSRYAQGFSKRGYAKIRIGDSWESVKDRIGTGYRDFYCAGHIPLNGNTWVYAIGPSSGYWRYEVIFKNDHVSQMRQYYWTD